MASSSSGSPLDLFDSAVAGASSDELIEMWLRIMECVAVRVATYVDAVEEGTSNEIVNEAQAFARRAYDLCNSISTRSSRAKNAARDLYSLENDLLGLVEAGNA